MPKKEMSAAERTRKAYEESPYQDSARDNDMRNKLNAMTNTAGAGRGGQGGPTAKELRDYERKQNRGIYTAEMGAPPQEPEGMKRGGSVGSASKRADGIAQRGKTRGTTVAMCGGGMYKK